MRDETIVRDTGVFVNACQAYFSVNNLKTIEIIVTGYSKIPLRLFICNYCFVTMRFHCDFVGNTRLFMYV